jgi:hypothetical protein
MSKLTKFEQAVIETALEGLVQAQAEENNRIKAEGKMRPIFGDDYFPSVANDILKKLNITPKNS